MKPIFHRPSPDIPVLCVNCVTQNQPDRHFCEECGAPLSTHALTGHYESIFGEGFLFRRLGQGQKESKFKLVSMCVCLCLFLVNFFFFYTTWDLVDGNSNLLFSILCGIASIAFGGLFIKIGNTPATKRLPDLNQKEG